MSLHGKHIIVTSGPTREGIDPVRYISNHSSGKQGHAIATALAEAGARVTLITGPTALPHPTGMTVMPVTTAQDMLDAALSALPADGAVCAAAVSDWRARSISPQKLKKRASEDTLTLTLIRNPDVLATIGHHARRPRAVIGFAAETEHVIEHAYAKLGIKGADAMLANDVSGNRVFGQDETHIHAVTREGTADWGVLSKSDAAQKITTLLMELLT